MSGNLEISANMVGKQLSNRHKRYLLVASNVYGDEYISPYNISALTQPKAIKRSKLLLPQIDIITSSSIDPEELLMKYQIYDYKAPATISIQYQSKGETKKLPVMYNDEVLNRIANQQVNNQIVTSQDTKIVFQNIKDKLVANENNLLNCLLYSNFRITDPRLRMILNNALKKGPSQIDFDQLYSRMHSYYKQWRTFYYYTSEHYQKDIAIKQKKM